jgi:hypothetical protein
VYTILTLPQGWSCRQDKVFCSAIHFQWSVILNLKPKWCWLSVFGYYSVFWCFTFPILFLPVPNCRVPSGSGCNLPECTTKFEIKTFTVYSIYGLLQSKQYHDEPPGHMWHSHSAYNKKFNKLDHLFASGVVGGVYNDIQWPFQASQDQFYRGTSHLSICACWSGEISDDFDTLLQCFAWESAAGNDELTISPLINTYRERETCSDLSMKGWILFGNTKHKLGCLHLH